MNHEGTSGLSIGNSTSLPHAAAPDSRMTEVLGHFVEAHAFRSKRVEALPLYSAPPSAPNRKSFRRLTWENTTYEPIAKKNATHKKACSKKTHHTHQKPTTPKQRQPKTTHLLRIQLRDRVHLGALFVITEDVFWVALKAKHPMSPPFFFLLVRLFKQHM